MIYFCMFWLDFPVDGRCCRRGIEAVWRWRAGSGSGGGRRPGGHAAAVQGEIGREVATRNGLEFCSIFFCWWYTENWCSRNYELTDRGRRRWESVLRPRWMTWSPGCWGAGAGSGPGARSLRQERGPQMGLWSELIAEFATSNWSLLSVPGVWRVGCAGAAGGLSPRLRSDSHLSRQILRRGEPEDGWGWPLSVMWSFVGH